MSNYLADRRKELGLTQKDVAAFVKVSEGTVSRWESGNIANMKRDKINLYAKVLKTTPAFIMTGENQMHLTITDTDPQLDELNRNARQLNAQGLQKLVDISDDMVTSGKYQKTALHAGKDEGGA